MKKDILVYFEDILESIHRIEEYTNNLTEENFARSLSVQDAILMRLALIGETANKIPREIRSRNSRIPWRKIINLRNIIVHDYSSINIERIWKIIKNDLLVFKKEIKELLAEIS